MTVVVNQQPIVELVGLEHEAGIAMRPESHRGADDAVPAGVHRRERGGPPRRALGGRPTRGTTAERHTQRRQKRSSIHARLRNDRRIPQASLSVLDASIFVLGTSIFVLESSP